MPRLSRYKWTDWAVLSYDTIMADRPDVIAIDTETSNVNYYDEAFCVTLTWRNPQGVLKSAYIDIEGTEGTTHEVDHRRGIVTDVLDMVPSWVFHNAKFDLQKLALAGLLPVGWRSHAIHDTQLIFHLLDENGRKGLKALAVSVLHERDTVAVEVKSGPNKGTFREVPRELHQLRAVRKKLGLKASDGYFHLPREVIVPYAMKDTEFTLRLYEALLPQLLRKAEKDPALTRLYADECELTLALLDMEARGMGVDTEYLDAVVHEYGVRVMEKLLSAVELSGNKDLNPASPKQLVEAFTKLGEPVDSTAVTALQEVVHTSRNTKAKEFAQAILDYRSDAKVYVGYLKALQNEQRGGIWHPNFNPVLPKTGRMSSSVASNK